MLTGRTGRAVGGLLALLSLLIGAGEAWTGSQPPSRGAKDPPAITIHLQVIEAAKTSTTFDPRIAKLHSSIVGYSGATLLDDLELRVEPHKTVSIDILKHSQTLKLTVRKVDPQGGLIVTRLAIEAFKFGADVTHRRNGSTVVVGHRTAPGTALFLAVTPRVELPPTTIARPGVIAPTAPSGPPGPPGPPR
jgi:hypothetical protein